MHSLNLGGCETPRIYSSAENSETQSVDSSETQSAENSESDKNASGETDMTRETNRTSKTETGCMNRQPPTSISFSLDASHLPVTKSDDCATI